MNIALYLGLLVGSLFILGKSAHFVTIAITRIGHKLGISEFITGFVILGIATSFPEIFVGIQSAISNTPQLSLGNLLGANIVLLTLISGITALLNNGINLKSELSQPGRLLQIIFLIMAPILVLLDFRITRPEALFLGALFVGYTIYLVYKAPKDSPALEEHFLDHRFLHTLFLFGAGTVGLLVASRVVVYSSISIATLMHIPTVVVGVLMLAVGTNLPEISVVIAAVRKHHTNLVIGDILGSAATNTLVVAMIGFIRPFVIDERQIIEVTSGFMIVALGLFFWFTKTKNRLTFTEGCLLLAFYASFVVSQVILLWR